MDNLNKVKKESKKWEKIFHQKEKKDLREVEEQIATLYGTNSSRVFSDLEKENLRRWEEKRKTFLKYEQDWRMKSQEIWIKDGDNNTKFFHNFSNH